MKDEHTSANYEAELKDLSRRILEMGHVVERQVEQAVEALIGYNGELAGNVLVDEVRVNSMELALDRDLALVISKRQPTARDLRLLIAISKSIGNLERIGDEASKIARTVQRFVNVDAATRLRAPVRELSQEAQLAIMQLRKTLEAFEGRDAAKALEVLRDDPSIDQAFGGLVRTLITYMLEEPKMISSSIDLIFVAKAVERIGDHAKNLAEQTIYLVTGEDVRHRTVDNVETAVRD
jgi:phosphate transport system protein